MPLLHSSLIWLCNGFKNSNKKSVVLSIDTALERVISNLRAFISTMFEVASSNNSMIVPVLGLVYVVELMDSSPLTNSMVFGSKGICPDR